LVLNPKNSIQNIFKFGQGLGLLGLLGLENGHFWAKLHLYSKERHETAGSSVIHRESVQSE
jgi:hypothetical protein